MYYRRRKRVGLISLIVGGGLLFILIVSRFFQDSNATETGQFISPLAEEVKAFVNTQITNTQKSKNPTDLLTEIKQIIDTQKGSYSIYIYDLTSNSGFGLNETAIFTGASVNKIYILAALYHEAKEGELDLDRDITIQTRDIQNYGTGVIRYQGAGTTYSLKTLAQLLMEKSDNTAAYVLTNIVGENRIQQLVDSWGMTQTNMINNKTSNKDVAMMLIKMHRGEITDRAHTQEMMGFMDDSDFENRLPQDLPTDVTIYHKIGSEIGNIHDVGIVAHPKSPYFIGVLTNDISDEAATEIKIAEISKIVFDYMTL